MMQTERISDGIRKNWQRIWAGAKIDGRRQKGRYNKCK
jgi:hypothetical protein